MPPASSIPMPENKQDMIESDEHILVVVRKHWVGIVGIYALAIALAAATVAMAAFVLPQLELSHESLILVTIGGLFFSGLVFLFLFAMAYVYGQSHLTLTDKSCIQVIQRSLFNRKTSRLSMSNVEDVNVDQRGIIASIFNYGTLTIQTAGEEDNFIFNFCPCPNLYAERILDARQAYAQHHPVS